MTPRVETGEADPAHVQAPNEERSAISKAEGKVRCCWNDETQRQGLPGRVKGNVAGHLTICLDPVRRVH